MPILPKQSSILPPQFELSVVKVSSPWFPFRGRVLGYFVIIQISLVYVS